MDLLVSLSGPLQAWGRLVALVSSADLLQCLLELLDPHCPCGEQQSLAVEADVGVEAVAALSLRRQTPGDVSWWQCRSGRVLAVWCSVAQVPRALH